MNFFSLTDSTQYVEKVKSRVVVEGAVDEIFESGSRDKNEPTSVEQAQRFLSETGVDILVPNVGTEHRATGSKVNYQSDQARKISAAVGKILCLHGTSSVAPADLPRLPADGFVKINVYTTLAVAGGQAVARKVLNNLGNIFTSEQIDEMILRGILGSKALSAEGTQTQPPVKPKLACVANPPRRDVWFAAVRDRCLDFLEVFNYYRFAQ